MLRRSFQSKECRRYTKKNGEGSIKLLIWPSENNKNNNKKKKQTSKKNKNKKQNKTKK